MSWNPSRLISGLGELFGSGAGVSDDARSEDVRQTMLDFLGREGCNAFPALERRILFQTDAQGLWYLRGDLLQALSAREGESSARKKIEQLTLMFQGLLPRGLSTRSSPLGD